MPRTTSHEWIEAGFRILESEGHGLLTVDRLCEEVGRTKGSFYHHFGSRSGFAAALLDVWQGRATQRIVSVLDGGDAPMNRLRRLNREASELGVAELERAMRSWAHHDPDVRATQQSIDATRLGVVEQLLTAIDLPDAEAKRLAQIFNLVFIGAQHLDPPLQGEELYSTFRALDPLLG